VLQKYFLIALFILGMLDVPCISARQIEQNPGKTGSLPGLRIASGDGFFEIDLGLLGGTSFYFIGRDEVLELEDDQTLLYKLQIDKAGMGIHFGIHSKFRAGPVFIRPDLVFNSNSVNFLVTDILNNSSTILSKERYQYLDIPILLGVQLKSISLMAGPVGHIFIANQSSLVDEIRELTTNYEKFTLGYQAGIGISLLNIGLDLRYEGNLRKFGEGIRYKGKDIYFTNNPSRLLLTLTFSVW
jgi:hypothetical protein